MRLHEINDMEAANAYLPEFIAKHNNKFAVEPKSSNDAHVKLQDNTNLDLVFCFKNIRTLSKNLEFSFNNIIYQVKTDGEGYGLRHAKVTVCEALSGEVTIIYKGRKLNYSCYKKQKKTAEIIDAKTINYEIDSIIKKVTKPSADHPWRQPRIRYAALSASC